MRTYNKKEISNIQIKYLKAIQKLQREKDIEQVTYKDIADELWVSEISVYNMVRKLKEKDYLERTKTGIYIIKNINLDKV